MAVAMKAESTQADGEKVLLAAAAAFRAALGERLLAAYALGSLAHGGFSPLVSDIDLGLVVEDPLRPDDANMIELVAQSQKVSGGPLSERLSVFWGTLNTLGGRRAMGGERRSIGPRFDASCPGGCRRRSPPSRVAHCGWCAPPHQAGAVPGSLRVHCSDRSCRYQRRSS